MRIYTETIQKCGTDCPNYQDENIDIHHGCYWTPARCTKANKEIIGADREAAFPSFCPLKEN